LVHDPETKEYVKAKPTETPPSDVYLLRAICKSNNKSWNEGYQVQTSDDWLIRWSESMIERCVTVTLPKEWLGEEGGQLNLRERPNTKSKILLKLD
jgi:hypothetical protein